MKKVLAMLLSCGLLSVGVAVADEVYDISPSGDADTDTQAIIDKIATVDEGSVITLAPGIYKINATISITRGVTLRGAGYKTCILDAEERRFDFMAMNHASAVVEGVTITNVRPANGFKGMAVVITGSGGKLDRCRITGCQSSCHSYGAVSSTGGNGKIYNCIIDHNQNDSALYWCGGVYINNGTMYNCLVYGNTSKKGAAGAFLQTGNAAAINCTFYGNTVEETSSQDNPGGGVWSDGNALVYNCVAYGNTAPKTTYAGGADFTCANYNKYYNCAAGSIAADILDSGDAVRVAALSACPFKAPDREDFSLVNGSPCIDAGSEEKLRSKIADADITNDVYGKSRILGASIDIGCAEFDPNEIVITWMSDETSVTKSRGAVFTAAIQGVEAESGTVSWRMTPRAGGPVEVGTGASFAFKPAALGWYDISVSFTKDGDSVSDVRENYLYVGPETNYVSAVGNPLAQSPFATQETAASSIQEAVNVAAKGTVVVLLDGVHKLKEGVVIDNGAVVVGSGWNKCEIYGDKTQAEGFPNPMIKLNHEASVLQGVHVRHVEASVNWTRRAAGVEIAANGGTLRRCRVSECTDRYGTAGVIGAVSLGGDKSLVSGCEIFNNSFGRHAANACGGIYLGGSGRIENTFVHDNVSNTGYGDYSLGGAGGILAEGGTVLNCTVVGNVCYRGTDTSRAMAGGICALRNAVVQNCIVQGCIICDKDDEQSQTALNFNVVDTASVRYSSSSTADIPEGNGNRIGTVVFKRDTVVPAPGSIAARSGSVAGFEAVCETRSISMAVRVWRTTDALTSVVLRARRRG